MPETGRLSSGRIDVDNPRWSQATFIGRLKHFASITDFRNAVVSEAKLQEARNLVQQYREGREPAGTTDEQVWRAKKLYESAFHPDSGELQNVFGRMSFQVPGGMVITAGMLQFYRTNSAVILWQWINQSFNALVNYTNRNAASTITTKQMAVAYVSATSCALITALGFKSFMSTRAPPVVQRFVPFVAVAAANMVNIPLSRQAELADGVVLFDSDNNPVTESRYAAVKGISQVVFSRIAMAGPGMLTMPLIMEQLEKKAWFMKFSKFHIVFQTFMVGGFLVIMVPVACAMFPQRSSLSMARLQQMEPIQYKKVVDYYKARSQSIPQVLYFNKGL
jgi:tricarboxylate carrier